jgi:hypothetical protein
VSEHTLTVIAEAHLGLAETDGVLAGTDAIVLLQFSLVDTLKELLVGIEQFEEEKTNLGGEVDLNGLDADVLGTGRHGGGGVMNRRVISKSPATTRVVKEKERREREFKERSYR